MKQKPQIFFSGCLNKLLSEYPTSECGSVIENKLKFMSHLADLSINLQWDFILSVNSALYRALEQGHMSWSNWPTIETWLDRTVTNLHNKAISSGGKNPRPARDEKTDNNPKKTKFDNVEGIPQDWVVQQKLCIMFQLGRCSQAPDHTTKGGKTPLAHLCASCIQLYKGRTSDHGAKDCPHKSLFQ
jgi:hypothetical protein